MSRLDPPKVLVDASALRALVDPDHPGYDDIVAVYRDLVEQYRREQVLLVAVPRATVAAALGQMTDHTLYAEIADQLHIPLQREGWGEVLADADLRSDAVHANARGYEEFARSLMGTAVAVGLLAR